MSRGNRPAGKVGTDPVAESAPRWMQVGSVQLAWGDAAATALLFVIIGGSVDLLVAGGRPTGGDVVAMVGLAVLAALLIGAGSWFSQWASALAECRLRERVAHRVFDLGVVAASGKSGDLLSLSTSTLERVAQYRAAFLGPIAGSLTTPLLVLALMALLVDPVTAGWLAALLILVPLMIGGFQRIVKPIGAAYRRAQAQLTAGFLEAIQALETLVYARAADRKAAELADRGESHRRQLMQVLAGNQLLIFVVDAAFSVTILVAAAVLASSRVAGGVLSPGGGITIMLMSLLVVGPVDVVGQFFYIGIAGRAAQRTLTTFLQPAEIPPTTTAAPAVPDQSDGAAIVLADVTAGWPGAKPVITGLSVRIAPGERVALVGPSGIGKSTVSSLLQAHLLPHRGQVLVAGLNTSTADPADVRAQLSVVEQRTFLFDATVRENLALASPSASESQLWDALALAGLRTEIEAMPLGLETGVGEHGVLLSGGQAQRLAIARAALRDAPILILDEPTSQVDLAGEAGIIAALDRLALGRTVVMIAHRPGAILSADRVIDLGQKVAVAA